MQISVVHTPCKECVFAQYEGDTQIDCELGMINKFRAKGCEVVEVYDNDKEFYVINDARCFCARSKKWKSKQTKPLAEAVKDELKISYQVLVFEQGHAEPTIETLKSLVNQTIPPTHITVVNKEGPGFAAQFMDFLKTTKISSWNVKNMVRAEASQDEALNQVLAFRKEPYVGLFKAGCVVPKDTFERINKLIFDDMEMFTHIKPNSEGNGKIIPLFVYQKAMALGYTLDNLPEDQSKPLEITKICPNFPK